MSRKEISPKLALELRINFLDLLLATTTGKEVDSRSISRRTQSINSQLNESATQNDTVRRLLASCTSSTILSRLTRRLIDSRFPDDQNEPLLRLPPLDDSSLALAEADQLSPAARAVLVLESATEIIQLDKELREIEFLAGEDSAGVTGSKGVFDNAAFSSQSLSIFQGVSRLLISLRRCRSYCAATTTGRTARILCSCRV